jgi:PadR family transcriptional regulator, regulatory protein PadR
VNSRTDGGNRPAKGNARGRPAPRVKWGVSEIARRARFYRLKASGRKRLGVETETWARLTAAIGRVLEMA